MTAESRLWNLTGAQIGARANSDVLFVPLGSIEQHGPHLPVDTDMCLATAFAEALADAVDGLVAPGFNYGYRSQPSSGGGELFAGTISLTGATYSAIVTDLVTSYARHGHLQIALVNGHYENASFAIEGAAVALERGAGAAVVLLNWWQVMAPDVLDRLFDGNFPGWEIEHAGVIETSLMMHVDPDRVDGQAIDPRTATIVPPAYTVLPERSGLVDPSGVLRTAHGSSAELGRSMFEHALEQMIAAVADEFGARRTGAAIGRSEGE